MLSACGIVGYDDLAFGAADGAHVLLLGDLDGEAEIPFSPVVDGDVVRQQLPAPLELALKPLDGLLHLLD
jgi:hypothetical protein